MDIVNAPVAALLPPPGTLALFVSASVALAIIPGPVVLYVVARSLAQGRVAGLTSVLGASTGSLVLGVAAAAGLSALLAASQWVYEVVRLLGAAYLIWMGLRLLLAGPTGHSGAQQTLQGALGRDPSPMQSCARERWALYRDGFIVALFNPKTFLFFSAFLPQFITGSGHAAQATAQASFLALLFVLIATLSDAAYALLAGTLAPMLARHRNTARWGSRAAGVSFVALGLYAALSGRRH
jgi:threonine/homoserine/homoserine lactone efflux protein